MIASMPSIKVIVVIIEADSDSASGADSDLKLLKVSDKILKLGTASYRQIRSFKASGRIRTSL